MEYNPRYPQPFTLTQAIALDPEVAWDEIARLRNSLLHLRRSQNELQEYMQELAAEDVGVEVSQAMKENETTIASQDERIFMLRLALTHHGYSVASERASAPIESNSNGQDHRTSEANPEPSQIQEHQNGVYL